LLDKENELVSYIKSKGQNCPALARGLEYNERETQTLFTLYIGALISKDFNN